MDQTFLSLDRKKSASVSHGTDIIGSRCIHSKCWIITSRFRPYSINSRRKSSFLARKVIKTSYAVSRGNHFVWHFLSLLYQSMRRTIKASYCFHETFLRKIAEKWTLDEVVDCTIKPWTQSTRFWMYLVYAHIHHHAECNQFLALYAHAGTKPLLSGA